MLKQFEKHKDDEEQPKKKAKKEETGNKTCDEIIEGLYLGSVDALKQVVQGNPLAFDCVISVLDRDQILRHYRQRDLDKVRLEAHLFEASDHRANCTSMAQEQNSATELKGYFESSANIIDAALREGKKVLVHCHSGLNRSASLVLNYLLTKKEMNWREACQTIIPKRGIQLTKSNRANLKEIADALASSTMAKHQKISM